MNSKRAVDCGNCLALEEESLRLQIMSEELTLLVDVTRNSSYTRRNLRILYRPARCWGGADALLESLKSQAVILRVRVASNRDARERTEIESLRARCHLFWGEAWKAQP